MAKHTNMEDARYILIKGQRAATLYDEAGNILKQDQLPLSLVPLQPDAEGTCLALPCSQRALCQYDRSLRCAGLTCLEGYVFNCEGVCAMDQLPWKQGANRLESAEPPMTPRGVAKPAVASFRPPLLARPQERGTAAAAQIAYRNSPLCTSTDRSGACATGLELDVSLVLILAWVQMTKFCGYLA